MFKKTITLLLVVSAANLFADPPLPTPVGRVVWVKGTFNATMDNKEKRTLQKMSLIYLHDTLSTLDNSQAQIVFTDDSLITFTPNTQFLIKDYQFKGKAKDKQSAGKYVMSLIEGTFRTVTGLIAKANPSDYQINTPVATIGVRGTDFKVSYKDGKLDMGFNKGQPCIIAPNKKPVCLDSNNPYLTVTTPGGDPVYSKTAPSSLQQSIEIEPAQIAPFTGGGSGKGGTSTSFCIS